MKTGRCPFIRAVASTVIVTFGVQAGWDSAQAKDEAAFPNVVPFELGTWAFAPGDSIKITSLRGTRTHLQADGSYRVEGAYTLASAEKAVLLFSCTSSAQTGYTPVSPGQEITATRGSGTFSLSHPPCDGMYHVSFYVAGESHSHGGVYFGEKGVEASILRETDWPDFSKETPSTRDQPSPGGRESVSRPFSTDPNRAILAYLGHPVPAPSGLDANYAPTNLLSTFTEMCRKAGWGIKTLSVDDSEFPFLVYGVLDGNQHVSGKYLPEIKGYTYAGSVVGRTDGTTYFALNIIPHDQYPGDQAKSCDRRLMIRLQMLADIARRSE